MSLARGDVFMLRTGRYAPKAALVWAVSGDDVTYIPIQGARGLDRCQRHRAEVDVPPLDGLGAALPMKYPVVHCHRQHKLDLRRLPSKEPTGRMSPAMMAAIVQAVSREIATCAVEARLTFRQDASVWPGARLA
jgi:hypothetical protein